MRGPHCNSVSQHNYSCNIEFTPPPHCQGSLQHTHRALHASALLSIASSCWHEGVFSARFSFTHRAQRRSLSRLRLFVLVALRCLRIRLHNCGSDVIYREEHLQHVGEFIIRKTRRSQRLLTDHLLLPYRLQSWPKMAFNPLRLTRLFSAKLLLKGPAAEARRFGSL